MAYKEVFRVQIAEVARRWQAGNSQRSIATGTGLSRNTIRKYLPVAKETGVSREGPASRGHRPCQFSGLPGQRSWKLPGAVGSPDSSLRGRLSIF